MLGRGRAAADHAGPPPAAGSTRRATTPAANLSLLRLGDGAAPTAPPHPMLDVLLDAGGAVFPHPAPELALRLRRARAPPPCPVRRAAGHGRPMPTRSLGGLKATPRRGDRHGAPPGAGRADLLVVRINRVSLTAFTDRRPDRRPRAARRGYGGGLPGPRAEPQSMAYRSPCSRPVPPRRCTSPTGSSPPTRPGRAPSGPTRPGRAGAGARRPHRRGAHRPPAPRRGGRRAGVAARQGDRPHPAGLPGPLRRLGRGDRAPERAQWPWPVAPVFSCSGGRNPAPHGAPRRDGSPPVVRAGRPAAHRGATPPFAHRAR